MKTIACAKYGLLEILELKEDSAENGETVLEKTALAHEYHEEGFRKKSVVIPITNQERSI